MPNPRPVVHLVNPMWDAAGGSEWRTMELYRSLSRHGEVRIWSEYPVAPAVAAAVPVARIGPEHPTGGVLAIIGVYFEIGPWLRRARPSRVRLLVNTPNADQTHVRYLRLLGDTGVAPEVLYSSAELAARIGLPGAVERSMIDVARFRPDPELPVRERFTVGRASRDVAFKHHPEDPELYARLVAAGCDVRLMGATTLAGRCPPEVTLLPANAVDMPEFLRQLDCFYYRTDPTWFESYGRVVWEAMACGLPVVCERRGGYAELLRHGSDAFLFDTMEEALSLLGDLHADPALRASVGAEARRTIDRSYRDLEGELARSYFGE
jgi:glycosyltransferase involved in cell wall biosynthesis